MSRDDRRRSTRVRAAPERGIRGLPGRDGVRRQPARAVGLAGLVGTVVLSVGLGGCSSLFAVSSDSSTSTTGATTASTSPASTGADVAFPVSACTTPPAATSATSGATSSRVVETAVHTNDTVPTESTSPVTTEPVTPTTATPTTAAPATTVPGPPTTIPGGSRSYSPRPTSGTGSGTGSGTPSSPGSGSVSEAGHGWVPSVLLAPLPTSLVGLVSYYSDGVHTVLAPAGWTCSIVAGGSAATGLAVYPSSFPTPPVTYPVVPGSEGVFAIFTNTGSSVGVGFVCPYFAVASWQKRESGCANPPPAGQTFTMATPDVASVSDPAGVTGSLEGSGGAHAVTGLVIFPQIQPSATDGSAIDVAIESCSLVGSTLCPAILSDFSVREFPGTVELTFD